MSNLVGMEEIFKPMEVIVSTDDGQEYEQVNYIDIVLDKSFATHKQIFDAILDLYEVLDEERCDFDDANLIVRYQNGTMYGYLINLPEDSYACDEDELWLRM